MNRLLFLFINLFAFTSVHAQDFNYQFSHAESSYEPLTSATNISTGEDWSGKRFIVPIGFTFNFNGEAFDSLIIESNGFIKFDDRNAIVVYQGAGCKKDSMDSFSSITRRLDVTGGDSILKLQFKNIGYDKSDLSEHLDYQVWLYQVIRKVEIHTGQTSYNDYINYNDSITARVTPLVGLINPLQDNSVNGLLISGSHTDPVSLPLNLNTNLMYLKYIPPVNNKFVFTSNQN